MADIVKPKRQFIPGSVVRVRGQLMGVGKASLLGLLDEAEDIADLSQADRIAAREGVATDAEVAAAEAEPVEPTSLQDAVADRAAAKAAKVQAADGDLAAAAEADAKDTVVEVDVPSVPAPAGVEVEEPGDAEPVSIEAFRKAAATRAANKAKAAGK
jgi:hypothetical protein